MRFASAAARGEERYQLVAPAVERPLVGEPPRNAKSLSQNPVDAPSSAGVRSPTRRAEHAAKRSRRRRIA